MRINGQEPDPNIPAVREYVDRTQPEFASLEEVREELGSLDDQIAALDVWQYVHSAAVGEEVPDLDSLVAASGFWGIVQRRMEVAVGAVVFKRDAAEVEAPKQQQRVLDTMAGRIESRSEEVQQTIMTVFGMLLRSCVNKQHHELPKTRLKVDDFIRMNEALALSSPAGYGFTQRAEFALGLAISSQVEAADELPAESSLPFRMGVVCAKSLRHRDPHSFTSKVDAYLENGLTDMRAIQGEQWQWKDAFPTAPAVADPETSLTLSE